MHRDGSLYFAKIIRSTHSLVCFPFIFSMGSRAVVHTLVVEPDGDQALAEEPKGVALFLG